MATRAVPAPLAQLPNALTVGRLILVPVFVVALALADDGRSWVAGSLFLVAGITDQLDGWLARRWRVESEFGKYADPLADRLMIDAAAILLFAADRLPWPGLVVILGRDALLLVGWKVAAPRGMELKVNVAGKAATWLLYAALGFLIATHKGADWPLWIFWAGLAIALVAAVDYAVTAWREVRR